MERPPAEPTPDNYGRDDHSEGAGANKPERRIPRVPLSASELHGGGEAPKKEMPLFSFPEHKPNDEAERAKHDKEEKKKDHELGVTAPVETTEPAQPETPAEHAAPVAAEPTRLEAPELKTIEDDVWKQFQQETAAHAAPLETQPVTEINMPAQAEHQPAVPGVEHEINLNMWHESPINLSEPEPVREVPLEQTAEHIPAAPSAAGMAAEVAATEPGDNDLELWKEFNSAMPAAMELPADERFVSSLNEPEVPAPAMSENQPDGPEFATAEQLEEQYAAESGAGEPSQEAVDQQFYDTMTTEMSPQFMAETSDDYDTTQVPPGRVSYGTANIGSGAQPQASSGRVPVGAPGAVIGGGSAPGGAGNPNYNPVSYNTPFGGGPANPNSAPNVAPGGPGSPNLPPNTPNVPPVGPNGPGYNGAPNYNYYRGPNYGGLAGMAGPAMDLASRAFNGARAVEGGIIGGAVAGAVTGHMAGRHAARREVRHLRNEVAEQSQHITTLTTEQQYSNQQLDQLTRTNQELVRQQQSQQMQEQLAAQRGPQSERAQRPVTPQELAAVAAATAAAEQQEDAGRKLAPGEKMVRSAWHDVVVDRAGNVVQGQELGAGLAGDQKVEQTPRDLTVQAAQQQAGQFGALAAGQHAYAEYPQQQQGGYGPMIASGQVDPRYDLPSGQVDPQHRLEPPKNPLTTALTSPLLWVGVVVLILAFFAAAFL